MILVICCVMVVPAYAQTIQNQTSFWIVTDFGNVYPIIGPPPERPPGFDSAPFLNTERIDSMIVVAAGGPSHMIHFGEAGTVNPLPAHDPARNYMRADIIQEWATNSTSLFANMPVGELRRYTDGVPYMSTARVADASLSNDVLGMCNIIHLVSCVDNYTGTTLTPTNHTEYGYILDLPATGRTIINMRLGTTGTLEVMFTCPQCRDVSQATYGAVPSGVSFGPFGFHISFYSLIIPGTPIDFTIGNFTGLSHVRDRHTQYPTGIHDYITYLQDGTGGCTPSLSISGGSITGHCLGIPVGAGSFQSSAWQPLYTGWNSIPHTTDGAIIISSPGAGAKLQVRLVPHMTDGCCVAFDGAIHNKAGTAIIHNEDRHLLMVPAGGVIPADHAVLREMQTIRYEMNYNMNTTTRWLAHSNAGDTIYHGFLYGESYADWKPYKVMFVTTDNTRFEWAATFDPHFYGYNYTAEDKFHLLSASDMGSLMSSEIYDIRNHKMLRHNIGVFQFWDDTTMHKPYIEPWLGIKDNPIWEMYGVHLPHNKFVIVDVYGTIPIVKPTRISNTYLSSLPCGQPEPDIIIDEVRPALLEAYGSGIYDVDMLAVLLFAPNQTDTIQVNMLLQNVYKASRTYLDYVDGDYKAGDTIHIPILSNRPYLCTVIAPNILESQYLLYGLPFDASYVSFGGQEGIIPLHDGFDVGTNGTFTHNAGIQSPRDGVLALDITAGVGASVAALGIGDYTGYTGNVTQWWNGTLTIHGEIRVGLHTTQLGSWTIDTYDMAQEAYVIHDDSCYGRFVTIPDSSGYIVRTVTVPAHQGEHIPINIKYTVQGPAGVATPLCSTTTFESVIVQLVLDTFSIDVR